MKSHALPPFPPSNEMPQVMAGRCWAVSQNDSEQSPALQKQYNGSPCNMLYECYDGKLPCSTTTKKRRKKTYRRIYTYKLVCSHDLCHHSYAVRYSKHNWLNAPIVPINHHQFYLPSPSIQMCEFLFVLNESTSCIWLSAWILYREYEYNCGTNILHITPISVQL